MHFYLVFLSIFRKLFKNTKFLYRIDPGELLVLLPEPEELGVLLLEPEQQLPVCLLALPQHLSFRIMDII
jgi:hypothetical protein